MTALLTAVLGTALSAGLILSGAGPAHAGSSVNVTCAIESGANAARERAYVDVQAGDTLDITYSGCVWFRAMSPGVIADGIGASPGQQFQTQVPIPTSGTLHLRILRPVDTNSTLALLSATPVTNRGWQDFTAIVAQPSRRPAPADLTCTDVLLVTARGSGEPLGGNPNLLTLAPVLETVRLDLYQAGLGVRHLELGPRYTAPSVNDLLAGVSTSGRSVLTTVRDNLNNYLRGQKTGVAELADTLRTESARCPDQWYILAGYSQGAMVVADYLEILAQSSPTPAWANKIRAVLLVANPERVKQSGAVEMGTARPSAGVCSWLDPVLRNANMRRCWLNGPGDVTAAFRSRTVSVCNNDDPICATSRTLTENAGDLANPRTRGATLAKFRAVHSSYRTSPQLASASTRIAQLTLS